MKNSDHLVWIFSLIGIVGLCQAPDIAWQNTINASGTERLSDMIAAADGGYVIAGWSDADASLDKTENSNGGDDFWVLKLDASGNISWQNTIGGELQDRLYAVDSTPDGGYILGGYSNSNISGDKTEDNIGAWDLWIVKLDTNGTVQWDNTIGGTGEDLMDTIIATEDGGYLVGASSRSGISGDKTEDNLGDYDYWILKLNASGNIVWQNTIGGGDKDLLNEIVETEDSGYLLLGTSNSDISGDKTENALGEADYWIVKLDNSGTIEWQNTIGGSGSDWGSKAIKTEDGGYLLGGASSSGISGDKTAPSFGSLDYWIVKVDEIGTIQWQQTLGGNLVDELFVITPDGVGGYLLTGKSSSDVSGTKTEPSRGSEDYWIVKVDATGVPVWDKTWGGAQIDQPHGVVLTDNSEMVIAGFSLSTAGGDKTENSVGYDYWVLKTEMTLGVDAFKFQDSLTITPNPGSDYIHIDWPRNTIQEVKIYSMEGKLITSIIDTNNPSIRMDVHNLPSGIFVIKVFSKDETAVAKFIKN